ncbi:hypothetical protein QVD17_23847 [Tagetes erecta]|uniref:J domain-containing protein n=1 Tax=Tagetes erecta TaxID=13708 RepID=A0AAD8NUA8_TARER|nr:hypothetical protein QVD17_23847 [Tagetes erecta]
MDERIRKPGSDPKFLLHLSEQFLRRRHFHECRKYAQQAHQLNPNFPGVSQILAVADVLLASNHQSVKTLTGTIRDWYKIMQINRYSHDFNLITNRYINLYAVLNPVNNNLPFADEAFEIVCDAWYVLSNRVRKREFDQFLKKHLNDNDVDDDDDDELSSFWTVCPYCYCLYEFPRVYLELCLKCPNEKCFKAFTCVEIDRPPVEVLKEGKYLCSGFVLLGFRNGCWNPFVMSNKTKASCSDDDDDNVVKISDDEVENKSDELFNVAAEGGVKMEVDGETEKPNGGGNVGRKKSVAKKVTGVGNRVRKQGIVHTENIDDCEFF